MSAPSRSHRPVPPPPAVAGSAINAARRERELDALANDDRPVDMLVIGGGITGAGVALDAASRGLSVVLVEAHDLAFGTSRFSSKLVHGGLRYLASGDFGVAVESARERHLLMTRIAPHLIRALPQLLPFVPAVASKQRLVSRAGFSLGDGLRRWAGTPGSVLAPPRGVGREEALQLVPALRRDGLKGGILSPDGQLVDDARLVTAVARTAAAYGARVLTRVRADEVRADGALLHDELGGGALRLRARVVVNAAGVWASDIDAGIRLRPSRGTHLVLDSAALGRPTAALTVPHPGSTSRFVFALPQQLGRVIVGLTDEEAPGPVPEVAEPTEAEIDFLLQTVSRALERPLARGDVRGAFAGLRPLIEAEGSTADLSRRHHVAVSPRGIVNVLGGKLTTYRAMAQDAVDLACRHAGLPHPGCATAGLPLVGAAGSPAPHAGGGSSGDGSSPAFPPLLTTPVPASVRARYGEEAAVVLGTPCDRPGEPIAPGIDVTRAEIAFAVLAEGALNAEDVLDRRTRIGLVDEDRERARIAVAELVAETLEA